jgi:hypothetical protein
LKALKAIQFAVAFVLMLLSLPLIWWGVAIINNIWEVGPDSPDSVYVLIGGALVLAALGCLVGAFFLIRSAEKPAKKG